MTETRFEYYITVSVTDYRFGYLNHPAIIRWLNLSAEKYEKL